MNGAHWHLVTNHLPIIIPVVGLLIMISGIFLKSDILKRAAYCIFILGAITAIVAVLTGDEAEEVIEKIQGIDEHLIELHEETAEIFSILLYILGGLSLVGLWVNWKKKSFSKAISIATVVFAFIALFYAKQTGTTGGEIRHAEIRTDQINNNIINKESEEEGEEE
jgi:uncharacterized membrane protein